MLLLMVVYLYFITSIILAAYTIYWHSEHPSTTGSNWPMYHDVMMSFAWPVMWVWRRFR